MGHVVSDEGAAVLVGYQWCLVGGRTIVSHGHIDVDSFTKELVAECIVTHENVCDIAIFPIEKRLERLGKIRPAVADVVKARMVVEEFEARVKHKLVESKRESDGKRYAVVDRKAEQYAEHLKLP